MKALVSRRDFYSPPEVACLDGFHITLEFRILAGLPADGQLCVGHGEGIAFHLPTVEADGANDKRSFRCFEFTAQSFDQVD